MIAQSPPRYSPQRRPGDDHAEPSRHAALTSAAAAIRVRRASRFSVEQILLASAAVLFPLGLVFILLGWEGAAHNGHTYAQIDYLISGGIFGLGLSVAGGFMYFGYWLSRQLGESRRQNALTLQALQRLEDLLDFSVSSGLAGAGPYPGLPRPAEGGFPHPAGPGDPKGANGTGARASRRGGRRPAAADDRRAWSDAERPTGQNPVTEIPAVTGPVLYATPRGSLRHRPDCPVVAKRGDLRAVQAGTEGYGYCTMCEAADVAGPTYDD